MRFSKILTRSLIKIFPVGLTNLSKVSLVFMKGIIFFSVIFFSLSLGGAPKREKLNAPLKLPPRFHTVFSVEMFELQGKMGVLLEGISRGKWQMVESTARFLADHYILKQQMSAKEKKFLKKNLPPGFVALDRYFHKTAAGLAKSARQRDGDQVLDQYRLLVKTCMECHGRFASYKFKDFKGYQVPDTIPKNFYFGVDEWK